MNLRDPDHLKTLEWLGELEAGEAKTLRAPVFAGSPGAAGLFGTSIVPAWQPGAKRDYAADAGDVRRNSLIAAGLSWIGKNFAEPRGIVERRTEGGDWEEVIDHPLARLIRRPNPHQSWQTIAKAAVAEYKGFGDGFLLIAKSMLFSPGDPIELWWMPRAWVRPRWDPARNEFLSGWTYSVNGTARDLDLDEVLHFQDGIDPTNTRMGLSALQSCLREVCTDNEAATYTAALLRNCGISSAMVSPANPEHSLGEDADRKRLAADLKKRTTGENAGEPLVMNIAMKVDSFGFSPEEMVLDKIRAVPESRLCAALGVSAMVLGLAVGDTQKTYSNYAEARLAAYEDCLLPDLKEWAFVINRDLLPLLGDPATERFRWDCSEIDALAENENDRHARAVAAWEKGLALRNEGRAMIGLPPVPAGEVFFDGSPPTAAPAEGPAIAPGATPAGELVQDQALNGAQIQALSGLVAQVALGQMPAGSARAIVLAAFPALPPELVDQILEPLAGFVPTPAAPNPGPGQAGAGAGAGAGPKEGDDADDADDAEVKALMGRMGDLLTKFGA